MNQDRVHVTGLPAWIRQRVTGHERFVLGVAGPPGSGKSTLVSQLVRELDAVVVPMDGFHQPNAWLDERGLRSRKGAPQTFAADRFVDAVRSLRDASADVSLPDFDRTVDEPRPDRIIVPADARLVIVEGNYLLLDEPPWSELGELFDAVVHLEVDATTRIERLIARHMRFGRTRADAASFVLSSDEPNAALVEAVWHRADVIVELEPAAGETVAPRPVGEHDVTANDGICGNSDGTESMPKELNGCDTNGDTTDPPGARR